jgi:hypothetical protein
MFCTAEGTGSLLVRYSVDVGTAQNRGSLLFTYTVDVRYSTGYREFVN